MRLNELGDFFFNNSSVSAHLSDEREDVYCGDDLQGKNHGDADVEFLVLRLVAPHLEAQPCADTAADDGEQQEGGFGDAPL